jgi:hypothetical protein
MPRRTRAPHAHGAVPEGLKAKFIRQLIVQAKPEDVPPSWQMRAAEHQGQPKGRSF